MVCPHARTFSFFCWGMRQECADPDQNFHPTGQVTQSLALPCCYSLCLLAVTFRSPLTGVMTHALFLPEVEHPPCLQLLSGQTQDRETQRFKRLAKVAPFRCIQALSVTVLSRRVATPVAMIDAFINECSHEGRLARTVRI